jgi:four helix bundle protein
VARGASPAPRPDGQFLLRPNEESVSIPAEIRSASVRQHPIFGQWASILVRAGVLPDKGGQSELRTLHDRVTGAGLQQKGRLMNAVIRSFRDLDTWQAAMDLAVGCYKAAKLLPPSERFEMSPQIRKAATSVPSNIAEGHSTGSDGLCARHRRIALGSLGELDTQLELAVRVGLLPAGEVKASTGTSDANCEACARPSTIHPHATPAECREDGALADSCDRLAGPRPSSLARVSRDQVSVKALASKGAPAPRPVNHEPRTATPELRTANCELRKL